MTRERSCENCGRHWTKDDEGNWIVDDGSVRWRWIPKKSHRHDGYWKRISHSHREGGCSVDEGDCCNGEGDICRFGGPRQRTCDNERCWSWDDCCTEETGLSCQYADDADKGLGRCG